MCHFDIVLNINILCKYFLYYCSNTNNGCAVLGGKEGPLAFPDQIALNLDVLSAISFVPTARKMVV